jgi:hypothetical protein
MKEAEGDQTHTEKMEVGTGKRSCKPRNANSHQHWKRPGTNSPLEPLGGSTALLTF